MRTPVTAMVITRLNGEGSTTADDILVTEEPLEIRLGHGPLDDRQEFRMSVTMRTPGHDTELALGFLYTEGIIEACDQVLRVAHCQQVKPEEYGNVVRAELHPDIPVDPARWQRHFYTTSSCGVCGKSSLEAVEVRCPGPIKPWGRIDTALSIQLPERMRAAQTVFAHTGGIHAAALFDRKGSLVLLREDVGRHNAVDKVIGAAIGMSLDPNEHQMLVSGRAGFELVQKCVVAGIPLMAAVGAPSSIAVDLARRTGLTLIGFLRGDRFNIYAPADKS
ncbi:MAG: formate dehydrogenase accessory sulfurtransferase FdhD [Flavobacteriales bacterium]|nr:formate dehydrogenase accessory sulfurtransferase FdhD [Flavobacteriales bacterium]